VAFQAVPAKDRFDVVVVTDDLVGSTATGKRPGETESQQKEIRSVQQPVHSS
jgi:hypothetical protein